MDDLIDFPCSPMWASYYASKGMTRDYPREYYDGQEAYERIAALEQEVKQLRRLVAMKENTPAARVVEL